MRPDLFIIRLIFFTQLFDLIHPFSLITSLTVPLHPSDGRLETEVPEKQFKFRVITFAVKDIF